MAGNQDSGYIQQGIKIILVILASVIGTATLSTLSPPLGPITPQENRQLREEGKKEIQADSTANSGKQDSLKNSKPRKSSSINANYEIFRNLAIRNGKHAPQNSFVQTSRPASSCQKSIPRS